MPIYEYRCAECGHQDEHLQKVSEPPMSVCPKCGKTAYKKMLTAAGFQLKGSGWYATDFRNQGSKPADKPSAGKSEAKTDSKTEGKTETKTDSTPDSKAASKPDAKATSTPAVPTD